jgi:transposase
MGQYVGLDVSLETTKVHVLDEQGKRVWRGTCVSHPTAIEATIRKHAPDAVRIGLGNRSANDLVVAGPD